MNLIPMNSVSMPVVGDVATLPLLHQMCALQLHPDEELVVSSEDIRCMFCIFSLPPVWLPFLSFNKPVPADLVAPHVQEDCFLCAKVLPMGYLNSVGVAQHLHRNFLKRAQGSPSRLGPWSEIRRDRTWTLSNPKWRVYLDNLDVLEKINPGMVKVLEGHLSSDLQPLIQAYQQAGIPLNAKKSVKQKEFAEMQGADIDGKLGTGRPKGEKLGKYVSAALSLLRRARCSQKEIQIVGGGLVYFSMFRRPLMSCLNFIWGFIQSFEEPGPTVRSIPGAVQSEILVFLALLPLAHLDFRSEVSEVTTASDASLLGGGVCASGKVTELGQKVAEGQFRGELDREVPDHGVVCIGLFDGISSLRVALEAVRACVSLHISVECDPAAKRVVATNFPSSLQIDRVEDITPEMCREWAAQASSARLVLVGAGPPCKISRESTKEGWDTHPCLLVKTVVEMLKEAFRWCPVHVIQEGLSSMDVQDKVSWTTYADVIPYRICASQLSPCTRDRLYWVDWTLVQEAGVTLHPPHDGNRQGHGEVKFTIPVDVASCLEPGWNLHPKAIRLATFTTAEPSHEPRHQPAGFHNVTLNHSSGGEVTATVFHLTSIGLKILFGTQNLGAGLHRWSSGNGPWVFPWGSPWGVSPNRKPNLKHFVSRMYG